ncbi:MAG TPA: hypothetical protein DDX47_03490 [Candidatus Jacksonbacteria bacterium]|nr:MAG: hypothetical protein UW45_C0002G0024 [Parcubacteria group bacterium GW2011_GWC2_44_22]HBH46402.1 hypothetical protein [Candidatus Jacksonbacteria bacterium]HCC49780.1 hypothetical protein [Candidatus Jacksonbacteria bacterium]HCE49614.1 hypothetical protein [Candidatus Jacksonbacteria bacterium]HCR15713.1 hypothetical protein [Candidatus Jacksonbacteria bacterium]
MGSQLFNLFLNVVLPLGLFVGGLFGLRLFFRRRMAQDPNQKDVVFLIRLPKESAKMKEEKERMGSKTLEMTREKIGISQTLYANLSGLKKTDWFSRFFYGPQNYLSAELVLKDGLIHFYLVCPHKIREIVEQQIHAQFPDAEVTETPDYNIFTRQGEIAAANLRLRRHSILPLKTFRELESDPLNGISNALSKIDVREGALIQILARPKASSWSRKGMRVASAMQQGKKLGEAMGWNWLQKPVSALGNSAYGVLTAPQYGLGGSNKDQPGKDKTSQKDYRLSPLEEEMVKGIENKASQFAFDVNIRIVVTAEAPGRARLILNNIVNSFAQYDNGERGNGFRVWKPWFFDHTISDSIFRRYSRRGGLVLNTQELASLWHLPLTDTETPNILWLSAKRASPPVNLPGEGIILGRSVYRGEEKIVRMKREDRTRHMYIIGKSGSGKSVMLSNMAIQDIQNGEGVCVLDPHGDLVETILENVPRQRVDDVIYFNPGDMNRPIGLNMLEYHTEEQMDFMVQEMIAIFYKLFPPEMIGPMFEHNMRNVMLTLMADKEHPGTIADIPRMFTDTAFQKYKVQFVKDVIVRSFWEKEMAQTTDFHKSEMLGYLISKVGRFVENEMIRNIIGQPKSGFDFREVMDKKKILLINLSKGKTGEVNSSLLGLIIVAKLQMAAMSRAELPQKDRHDFYLYIDEFQNFITDSIATILSEARKYRLNLILAHQYLGQLIDEKGQKKILDAVLGNAGTICSFKIGVEDAETVAKEFAPVFNEYDLVNVDRFNVYLKLLIDNAASRPFNMETLPPQPGNSDLARAIKELSRLKYGRPKAEIDAEILLRTQLGSVVAKANTGTIESTL